MKISHQDFALLLGSRVDPTCVAVGEWVVDGVTARLECRPRSAEEVAAVLKLCAEQEAAVIPRGGGTAIGLGNPPARADLIVSTRGLDRVVEHDAANLTVTVESGIPLAALQRCLADRRQCLPVDAPASDTATIGGIVAANLNGPRRSRYGSLRDLVIGIRVALTTGETIKGGGKVVKNVAGYDMCKLFTGALGTLGVITELTLRLAPMPEEAATVLASGTLDGARDFALRVTRSPIVPAALAIAKVGTQAGLGEDWQAAVLCEGFSPAVSREVSDLKQAALNAGLAVSALDRHAHEQLWASHRDFPLQGGGSVFRITLPGATVGPFLDRLPPSEHGAAAILADPLSGTIWLKYPDSNHGKEFWRKLDGLARQRGGHGVLIHATTGQKSGYDVWGPEPVSMRLMREIKNQFDPDGVLNPGRFIGGL